MVDANPDGVQICDNYNVKRNLTWKEYRKYFLENVCAECGEPLDDDEPEYVINRGMENEFVLDQSCCKYLCNTGEIVQCVHCGALYTRHIHGCPHCRKSLTNVRREPVPVPHVMIEVRDGIVQDAYSDVDNIHIEVYDLDDEESSEKELKRIVKVRGLKKV